MKNIITCGCLSLSLLLVSVVVAQEPDSASEEPSSGTTYMLPEFQFTTVTTTVDVPEGGIVLLGGIKELAEQRKSESEASKASSTTTTSGTTINLPTFDFETTSMPIPTLELFQRLLYEAHFGFLSPFYRYESPQRQPGILTRIPYFSMSKALRVQGLQEDDVELQLMLLVTPRIIITEEEELRIGL